MQPKYINPSVRPANNADYGRFPVMQELSVGSGARSFKSDSSGIWLGANKFADAPFKVNMQGEMTISDADDASYMSAKVHIFYNSGVPEIVIGDPSEAP